MRSRHISRHPPKHHTTVVAVSHHQHVSAPYANTQDAQHAEGHSHVRAGLARTMDSKHSQHEHLHWRAEDSRIRDEVGARQDGRAYGSGVTNDARGHRLLHHHFATGGNQERPRSGPPTWPTTKEAHYPQTASNRHEPSWAGDTLPAYDHSAKRKP